ncbi:hypothetical protein BGZ46_005077, partial [Entomortierella lignicola]
MDGRDKFDAEKQHVSCIAHVINLAVQALIGKGGLGASEPEDVKNETDDNSVNYDDDEEGFDEVGFVSFDIGGTPETNSESDDLDIDEQDVPSVKLILDKLRMGLKKIRHSPVRLEKCKKDAKTDENLRGLAPLLDVCTRWRSTFMMLKRAIKCQDSYNKN